MAVRASFTESWTDANGNSLPLVDSENNRVSELVFDDSWEKNEDGYFYYGSKESLTKLNPEEVSTSFIKSITFNKNTEATLKKSESADKKIITYSSSGRGYDNAKYTLTIKIDTIQYD